MTKNATIRPMWIVRWENAPQGKLTTHEIDGAEMYCDKVVQRRPKVWRYEPKHGHGGDSRLCKPGVAAVDFTTTAALTAIEKMFIEEMVL